MRDTPAPLSVLLLCRYARLGASSRLRFLDYLPALEAHGIRTTVAPFFDDAYLDAYYAGRLDRRAVLRAYARRVRVLLSAGRHDLLWIEKEALPWLPAAVERWLLGPTPFVLDFDDAWELRYRAHGRALVRRLLGDKWRHLMPQATLAIAGSAALADWCRAVGAPRVEIIPTVIDLARYPLRPPPDNPVFTVGWIGTRSTLPHLAAAGEALRQVGGLRLRLIANEPIALPGVAVEFVPWREDREAELLADIDTGIMPLPDEPWERGKCAYKLIQYMAAGRPVVASPVGANAEVVVDGETGFLAMTTAEWVAALSRLKADAALRARMGAAGRHRVEQTYCLQVQAERLATALRTAVDRNAARPPAGEGVVPPQAHEGGRR